MLFMGMQALIMNKYFTYFELPKIDILKVGHHGSKTSTSNEFIQKYSQKFVWFL